ncbi:MAG TPA: DUF1488 family protein [Stellaceae bacterium]|nr:DUF1488 family protein [Stellaceae bacterium]
MPLTFVPLKEAFDAGRLAIRFRGYDRGTEVVCEISCETLQRHFALRGTEEVHALGRFSANLPTILDKASKKYDRAGAPVVLRPADFP